MSYYKLRKKIIGICFGHQLLAELFGGTVEELSYEYNIGIQPVIIKEKLEWMVPFKSLLNLSHCHRYVVSKPPRNSKVIAKNRFYNIASFVIEDNVLGIQAHPEILKRHCMYLEKEFNNKANNKLEDEELKESNKYDEIKEVDYNIVAKWLINFIYK